MKHHVRGAHHTSHEAQAGHIEAKDARSVDVARFIPIGRPVLKHPILLTTCRICVKRPSA